ncbi:hypothetical protein [Leptospira sp. GIMC2001]|uniref:hypothetical protein n=1 Tax=Leptospira sp. GIMC2001 TaxID=1513297 RepID=UPI002349982C|nr:hypothetical protein [Leptospira sp. GIMC2001]WCL50888.1 hypothetical protein O4O04_08775 [Leptospira sp. GIMC2001]
MNRSSRIIPYLLILLLTNIKCLYFRESDLDPNSIFSQIQFFSRLSTVSSESQTESSPEIEPILTRSLSGYANGTKAFFQWHPVPNASSYKLYYSKSSTVNLIDTPHAETTAPWIIIDGLDTSSLYHFQLVTILSDNAKVTHSQSYPAYTNSIPFGTSGIASAIDISASQGIDSGLYGVLNINPYTNKIYVTSQFGNSPGARIPSLFTCNSDGTNCTYRNLTFGNSGSGDVVRPHSAIDFQNNKIIYVGGNSGDIFQPVMFICGLDSDNCSYQDISAGQGNQSGQIPFVTINPLNGELLTLTRNQSVTLGSLSLFKCLETGSECIHTELSTGDAYLSTFERGSALVSPFNDKLYTVISGYGSTRSTMYISDTNGLNSTLIDIGNNAPSPPNSSESPSLLIDYINSKLVIVTKGFNNRIGIMNCDLDGSNCTYIDIGINSQGFQPSAIIDMINEKILIFSTDSSASNVLTFFRCELNGTGCTSSFNISASAGLGIESGYRPSALIDPVSGKILISTQNFGNTPASIPYLFIF